MAEGREERSFASELGDGLLGAGVVHELLAIGGGRNESGGGGVVERPRDAVRQPVQADDGVVHQASRGLPREVNNLALQALVATFAKDESIVDESAARMAVVEVVEQ